MAHGNLAYQVMEHIAIEDLRHQPHSAMDMEAFAVRRNDASALLTPMLERIQAIIRQLGGVGMTIDPEHATVMFRIVLH